MPKVQTFLLVLIYDDVLGDGSSGAVLNLIRPHTPCSLPSWLNRAFCMRLLISSCPLLDDDLRRLRKAL